MFNPRIQEWIDYFQLEEVFIVGLTPEGRVTVLLLQLNSSDRLKERQRLQSL